jgi:hypothetical protein
MTATVLLHEFRRLRVRLRAEGDRIIACPLSAVPPELRAAARTHKTGLLRLLTQSLTEPAATTNVPSPASQTADEALKALRRLKGYALPAGRIPVIRELAERLHGLTDPAALLYALQIFETELLYLGGSYDPQLASVIEGVTDSLPGARLVEVRKVALKRG